MASTPLNNGDGKSDLAVLWGAAVEDYERRTGRSLKFGSWRSMDEVIQGTEVEVNKFKGFRHQDGKADKVRTAFKNNLWLIQTVVNAIQIAGSTAAAFPPAMPASLLFSAFGQVMNSFSQMSADYDKVVGFFEFTQRFLDRLSMIEGRSPPLAPFQRCITRVFSSMLTICAVAQEYAKEHGRFKKWFNTLLEGTDPGLAGAYKDMELAINEMSQAVNMATLRTVQILAEIVKNMEEDVEFIVTKTTFIDERTKVIESKVDIVIGQGQVMDSKQDALIAQGQVMDSKQDTLIVEQREMSSLVKKLYEREFTRGAQEKDAKNHPGHRKPKTDPGENKRVALNQVAAYFNLFSRKLSFVSKETKAQRKEINVDVVEGTGMWLLHEEEIFKDWADQKNNIIWLRGEAGIGKSFLAETVITDLESSSTNRKTLAYFFFREEEDSLRSFTEALYCMSFQMAETDLKYCEQIATELTKNIQDPFEPWKVLFAERFPSKGEDHAYLILDGIDEMKESELKEMIKCLDQISQEDLNIHVLLTGRPSNSELMGPLKLSTIEISREKLAGDIEKFIHWNLKKLPRIKKFRKQVRVSIFNRVRACSDGMRYVDHMLRRINLIGREKAVIKDLAKGLPENLQELYELMLNECQANRTKEQYSTLKKLFAWLAYSKRPLTLDEAAELIARTVNDDKTFDIEDEIIGRSSRILEIVRSRDGDDDDDDEADDSDRGDGGIDDIQDGGQTPLGFQERSLREYFQAVDVDEQGLRTPPSAAHLTIFEMAADLLFNAGDELKDDEQPKLLSYAADFWAQHFVEIDLSKTTDAELKRVVEVLYKLLNNHNNVAIILEHFAQNSYSDIVPESGAPWLNTLKEWTGRAVSSNTSIILTPEVENWAKETTVSEQPLMILARGHVLNWYKQHNGLRIVKSFTLARDAFKLSNLDVSENSVETVLKVADYFTDIEKTVGSMRAISATLAELELIEDSMKYVTQGLEMLDPGKSVLRFYLIRSLSLSHAELGRHEESIPEIDKAVESLPDNWRDDEELVNMVEWIYQEKGSYLDILDRPEEAIQAYHKFKNIKPELTIDGYYLDDMARIWTEARDPDGSKLLSLLREWNEKERIQWLGYVFRFSDSYAIARFNQIAAQNKKDGSDLILEFYNAYMATIPPSVDQIIFPQVALANIYRIVIGDHQKAKEIYMQVLKRDIKEVEVRGSVDATLFEVRRALAEIIFEEFRTSTDLTQKRKLLDEMKNFPNQRTDSNDFFQLQGSNISIMVALMNRVVGQPAEFQAVLQKTFDTCVEGLSDTVGWNDQGSFRLLGKVLACVEGLERDAVIAVSSQMSRVTDEPEEPEDSEEPEKPEVGDEPETAAAEELSPINGAAKEENGVDSKESGESNTETPDDHRSGPIHITETTVSRITVEDGVMKEDSKVIIEQASVEAAHGLETVNAEEAATTGDVAKKEVIDMYANEETVPPIPDEDRGINGPAILCDGECGRTWTAWEVPIYLCLLCTTIDLCPTCYGKRIAQNRGEVAKFWRPYCGVNHLYAKAPIKGWKGVKGGVIRIEGEDGEVEEIKFQDWLNELKEKRWPEAWEKFWTRLEGVKDIGF